MEDDTTSEGDEELQTFNVEFSASELYSLHGLLRHLSIELEPREAVVAQSLAKLIHNEMVDEEFNQAMRNEMDEFKEQQAKNVTPDQNMMGSNIGQSFQ